MGTWEHGIIDNDAAYDGLDALRHEVVEDIVNFETAKPTTVALEKVCAAVGVLLQLSAYDFDRESPNGPKIVAALKRHAAAIESLPAASRKIVALVIEGKGKALAERPGKMSAAHAGLLRAGSQTSPFGHREPALFDTKVGAAYVQSIAKRCAATIDEDFEDESNWSDLCRESMGMGLLGALMVLEPCKVPPSKVETWRKKAQKGLATLREEADEELDFHEVYYANLDKVFAVLAKRFARAM